MDKVILFDGDCQFCNGAVNFIIKRDPQFHYLFASLQSEVGQQLLAEQGLSMAINSIVYIDGQKAYLQSTAALRICRNLSGFWKVFYCLLVIPKPIRDFFYNLFAKYRYTLFGKRQQCYLFSSQDRKRFL